MSTDAAEGYFTCSIPEIGPKKTEADQALRAICPNKMAWVLFCVDTGAWIAARCERNSCLVCGPINAWLIGQAIAQSKPERMIRLSLVGEDHQVVRARMKRVAYLVRQQVDVFEWCWQIEPNPKGTGYHAHGYGRGSYVPQRLLANIADQCGMGRNTDVRRFRPRAGNDGVTYGAKLATGIGYGMKLADKAETLGRYLECNGNRLVHASRGFWLDADGQHTTMHGAIDSWRNANGGGTTERWELVRRDHLIHALNK